MSHLSNIFTCVINTEYLHKLCLRAMYLMIALLCTIFLSPSSKYGSYGEMLNHNIIISLGFKHLLYT